ncbi:MAG: hypothetical protein J6J00_06840 [Treponema sp.]|nr:hypothetical protein [Treponema sp.]
MKKLFITLSILLAFSLVLTSCADTEDSTKSQDTGNEQQSNTETDKDKEGTSESTPTQETQTDSASSNLSSSASNISLKAVEGGIEITVTKDDDWHFNITKEIACKENGLEAEYDESSFTDNKLTFLFPFTTSGETYTFTLKQDRTGKDRLEQSVSLKATGGIGNPIKDDYYHIRYEAYYNETANNFIYTFSSHGNSISDFTNLDKSLIELNESKFKLDIWKGNTWDWLNELIIPVVQNNYNSKDESVYNFEYQNFSYSANKDYIANYDYKYHGDYHLLLKLKAIDKVLFAFPRNYDCVKSIPTTDTSDMLSVPDTAAEATTTTNSITLSTGDWTFWGEYPVDTDKSDTNTFGLDNVHWESVFFGDFSYSSGTPTITNWKLTTNYTIPSGELSSKQREDIQEQVGYIPSADNVIIQREPMYINEPQNSHMTEQLVYYINRGTQNNQISDIKTNSTNTVYSFTLNEIEHEDDAFTAYFIKK